MCLIVCVFLYIWRSLSKTMHLLFRYLKQTCETNEKAMRSSCFMTFVTPKRPVALCLISRPIPISTSHRRWEKLANLGRNFKDLPQLYVCKLTPMQTPSPGPFR